jgi:branched-chain amino acid transport system permease protein
MDMQTKMFILNGVTQAALLFILGSGLTLAFGLMRVVNLSHGAFYLLGGYIGYSVFQATQNWWLSLIGGAVSIALVGFLFEKFMLVRVRNNNLGQTLLTIALGMIISDLCLAIWGGTALKINVPKSLNFPMQLFGVTYPSFRYFLIIASIVIAIALYLILYKTKIGAGVRAGVDDRETANALGINISAIYTLVFVLSAFLVGIAGVLGATYLNLAPGADTQILTYALVIVIVGGMGSLSGAIVSSLILGQMISFSRGLIPEYSMFVIFIPMVIVLAIRPQGLFGRKL